MMKRSESQQNIFGSFSKPQIFFLVVLQLVAVVLSILYPALLSSSTLHQINLTRDYKAGELSDEDVIAQKNYSFIDEVATDRDRQKAADGIAPFFSFSITSSMLSESLAKEFVASISVMDDIRIKQLFEKFDEPQKEQLILDSFDLLSVKERNTILLIIRDAADYFSTLGIFSSKELENAAKNGKTYVQYEAPLNIHSQMLSIRQVPINSLVTFDNLYSNLISWLSLYSDDVKLDNVNLIYNSLTLLLKQNVFFNEQYTGVLEDYAMEKIVPTRINVRQGDYILKTDEIITELALRTIEKINTKALDISWSQLLSYFIFAIAVVGVITFVVGYSKIANYRIPLFLITLFGLMDVILAVQYFWIKYLTLQGNIAFAPFLPCFFLPLFYSYITNRQYYGFTASILYISLIIFIPTSNVLWLFYFISLTGCSLFFMRLGTNRIDIIYQAFYTALTCAAVTIIFHFASGYSLASLATSIIGIVSNVGISYILISIILPIYERLFNVPTKFRLYELGYTDTPILNRLNQVALGTFNHSKNVAEMAYEGAKAIKANADLARVGAMYHDIGKTEHPEYFIENQQGGPNLHDGLNFTLSAAIIKSHVRLGIEKAKEAGLPQEVIDIIAQHHGDDVIQYFYNEALKASKGGNIDANVYEEDFRYTGEKPNSVESVVVMLADCVEAASRTLKKPTSQRYDKLISTTIVDKINRKQLDNSPLTLENLNILKQAFIHVLLGRDHQRIKYDDEGDKE